MGGFEPPICIYDRSALWQAWYDWPVYHWSVLDSNQRNTILRIYSRFSLRLLLLLGTLVIVAGALGCYPHQGKPVDAAPDQLLALAHDACHRHDLDAWQMLLGRLAERHPQTPQGVHARRLLDEQSGSLTSCKRTLQADKIHD
jgi:hypothetical protein